MKFEIVINNNFESAFSLVNDRNIYGTFGLISNDLKKEFDVDQEVYFAELNWSKLTKDAFSKKITFEEITKFPFMRRDFSLLIDHEISFDLIKEIAFKTEKKILKHVTLFDVYEGENLPKDKKSYGINFTFQDKNRTLTDIQIDKVMDKLLKNFKQRFEVELR